MNKIALIIPCAQTKPFRNSSTWKFVEGKIKDYREHIDLFAVECIDDCGLLAEWEQEKVVGKDKYPSWEYYHDKPDEIERLTQAIQRKINEYNFHEYMVVYSYIHVKAYDIAFKEACKRERLYHEELCHGYARNNFLKQGNNLVYGLKWLIIPDEAWDDYEEEMFMFDWGLLKGDIK